MREEYIKIVNSIYGFPEDSPIALESISDTMIIGFMICERLERIACALESLDRTGIRTFPNN